jgi:hypothetical protein
MSRALAASALPIDALTSVDGLERTRFAKHLLKVLCRVESGAGAVVGLEGPKTTMLVCFSRGTYCLMRMRLHCE